MKNYYSVRLIKQISTHLLMLGLLLGLSSQVWANVEKAPHSEAELVSEGESIQPGQPFWVALRLKAEDHWHTYWINPGDSGLATTIKWELPEGFKADVIQWSYPDKIEAPPLISYGYDGEVFLLVQITPPATLPVGTPIKLNATAKWLVCKEACIPGSAKLFLELPVKNEAPKIDAKWSQAFTDTRAKLPINAASANWKLGASLNGDKVIITAQPPADFKNTVPSLVFFPTVTGIIDYAAPQNFQKTATGYTLEVKRSTDSTEAPTKLQGVLVSGQNWIEAGIQKALAIDIPFVANSVAVASFDSSKPVTPTQDPKKLTSLWLAIVFSFIGGLILNLMPCVLPVLSLKVLDFVKQAAHDSAKTWHHGVIFTLGVLVTFWVLAGGLIALRAGGEKLGWGFQLQSPTFLVMLAALFFLFGLNLFGVFEVGTSLMSVGGNAMNKSGWMGSFSSGALATIVATPCTAPFMGSALGFALTQPVWASMLIFTSVALGMATPYLLLSCSPSLLKYVPKPGAWMETFKQFMGFLLMATVVWLAWVLGLNAGIDAVAALLMALVVMGMGGWVLGRWGTFAHSNRSRLIAQTIMVLLVLGGASFAITKARDGHPGSINEPPVAGSIPWQPFSPKLVEELHAAGKPVFVDFTAAWCLSCQVNERVTFSSTEVKDQFNKLGIVPLRADWTSRDETITRTLEGFGRSGVPLYVMYHPKEQSPVILPEVITPSILLEEFKKVEKNLISKN